MPPAGGAPLQTYLVPSIIVTIIGICSCVGWIPGVIAIIFAVMAGNKAKAGDMAGAQSNAKIAKIFLIIAIVLLVIGFIIGLINAMSGNGYFGMGG